MHISPVLPRAAHTVIKIRVNQQWLSLLLASSKTKQKETLSYKDLSELLD